MEGQIVDKTVLDTASANPTATYPLQEHGGDDKTYQTIYTDRMTSMMKIVGLDPTSDPTDVQGVGVTPVPNPLPRTPPVVGIVNAEARGVYFEGTLVPVIGDGITGTGAVPTPRPLTSPAKYPTIFIGTRT
jgi:hypothetical protein